MVISHSYVNVYQSVQLCTTVFCRPWSTWLDSNHIFTAPKKWPSLLAKNKVVDGWKYSLDIIYIYTYLLCIYDIIWYIRIIIYYISYILSLYIYYMYYISYILSLYIYPGPSHGPSGSSVPHAPRAARWSAAPQSPQPSWGAGFATPNCGFYGDLTAQKNDETWNFYVQVWHDEEMTDQTMFFGGFNKNSAVQNPSN